MIRIINDSTHGRLTRFYDKDGREIDMNAYRVHLDLAVDGLNRAVIHCYAGKLDLSVLPENVTVYVNDVAAIAEEARRQVRLRAGSEQFESEIE